MHPAKICPKSKQRMNRTVQDHDRIGKNVSRIEPSWRLVTVLAAAPVKMLPPETR
eukprot:COSAG02_NODE_6999_length_3235_cov_90.955038_5_plen_54_part_01